MTESLFDTKFTGDAAGDPAPVALEAPLYPSPESGSPAAVATPLTLLPLVDDTALSLALIVFRVLVSAKEAGCLIGQHGLVIDSIRNQTNTRAGISKLQPGSHERILTVLGTLDDAAKALSLFAQTLVNLGAQGATQPEYAFFPLKQLSATPNIDGETTTLRLLVPHKQMGTLIGAKGARIQQIQQKYDVLMIASKLFLPNSNERLVELQGTTDALHSAIRVIARCLIEDFSLMVGTNYYEPRGLAGRNDDALLPLQPPLMLLKPLSLTPSLASALLPLGPTATKLTLLFPNDFVGALIGKNGLRIQGVRKVLGAVIGISDEEEGKNERTFTISGLHTAVGKAKEMLYHNLHREELRRAMVP